MDKKNRLMEEIDVLIDLSEVHTDLQDISKDFIYAKLKDEDEGKITEFVAQTQFCTNLVRMMKEKYHEWEWDNSKRKWKRSSLKEIEKDKRKKIENFFNVNIAKLNKSFMIRPYMKCVLNRNKKENHLINLLGKNQMIEEELMKNKDEKTRMDELKELVKTKFGEQ